MQDSDEEECKLASNGLRQAVKHWLKRHAKKDYTTNDFPTKIGSLLDHMAHFLLQLTRKRRSLQRGLLHVRQHLWPQILKLLGDRRRNQVALLKHLLMQILRLHDGLSLLVSGECRHPGDIQEARKSSYPSRLLDDEYRPDGYTKLYNAPNGYSGYGWDEFHDPDCGLQSRLLVALSSIKKRNKSTIWDSLLDRGGQAVESILDRHEAAMKEIQQSFVDLRVEVVRELQQVFRTSTKNNAIAVDVTFVLHDKMEKLQVVDQNNNRICLERRGDAFQIIDKRGALPIQADWPSLMKLPPPLLQEEPSATSSSIQTKEKGTMLKKRRRRVIDDTDDESTTHGEDQKQVKEDAAHAPKVARSSQGGGLRVKVIAPAELSRQHGTQEQQGMTEQLSSLKTIKAQMGVDVQELESAREILEAEEAHATKAAQTDENDLSIEQGERKIKALRRVLKRVLARDRPDENEIWDARETLRETLMLVGNQLLWKQKESTTCNSQNRQDELERAHELFSQAKELVQEQQQFHSNVMMATRAGHDDEFCFFQRNLLLLRGQACTNMGISLVERALIRGQSKRGGRSSSVQVLFKEALVQLEFAQECAQTLRTRAAIDGRGLNNDTNDHPGEQNRNETKLDSLRADQLESLAVRWTAIVLWHQRLPEKGVEAFLRASIFFLECQSLQDSSAASQTSDDLSELLLQLGSEAFYACSTLADLASSKMETLNGGETVQGNDLLNYLHQALQQAKMVTKNIEMIFEKSSTPHAFPTFLKDTGVLTCRDIDHSLREIQTWWDNRQKVRGRLQEPTNNSSTTSLPRRNDLNGDARLTLASTTTTTTAGITIQQQPSMPTRRFNISSGPRRPYQHKDRSQVSKASNAFLYQNRRQNSGQQPPRPPQKFRRWGDDFLPQELDVPTGKFVPKLVYPSLAPPMPPEIKAVLEG